MRVAIVHDYLTQYGGAERVVKTLHELFTEAPIYTLFYDPKKTRGVFEGCNIVESFWAKIPILSEIMKKNNQIFFWLMPIAIELFDLRRYDIIISSSASFAKGIHSPPGAFHICYCHTPTRYLWDDVRKYVSGFYDYKFVITAGSIFLKMTKKWDLSAAARPHIFIANSNFTAKKIKKFYGRDVYSVLYPPVDVDWWENNSPKIPMSERKYYLMVGRLLKYKRFDIGIEISRRFGIPLKIVGEGREKTNLENISPKDKVEFLGWLPDKDLAYVYANAKALLMPQSEDFGIVAVEAISCGTPVITYEESGAAEIVIDGVNGIIVKEQSPEAFFDAILRLNKLDLNPEYISMSAKRFSKQVFKEQFLKILEKFYSINKL
jgi:glycosyltransferase involved in cell wall biosynthesis